MNEKRQLEDRREPEIVFSRSVKAGRRIYYLDVKKAKNDDLYVCITESKKKSAGEAEQPTFEKHKLFLYKEDFAHFVEGLEEVIGYVKSEVGEIEDREEWVPAQAAPEAPAAEAEEVVEEADEKDSAAPGKKRLLGFLKKR